MRDAWVKLSTFGDRPVYVNLATVRTVRQVHIEGEMRTEIAFGTTVNDTLYVKDAPETFLAEGAAVA